MYHTTVLCIIAVLLGNTRSANVNRIVKNLDNHIRPKVNSSRDELAFRGLYWIRRPPAFVAHKPGEVVELHCDVHGGPLPSIRWFKNDAPIYEYEAPSNLESIDPTSIGNVITSLLVSHTEGQDVYTCFVSGLRTARATTTVYSTGSSTEISERSRLYPLEPKIVYSYDSLIDYIGMKVVLPCLAKGHPRPHIVWTDEAGVVIKSDSRRKVLRSGELVFSPLLWTDMGVYECHASNIFGGQKIKTFVYPALPE